VDDVRVWRWIVPLAGTSALLHSAQPVRRAPACTWSAGPTPRIPSRLTRRPPAGRPN